jgi:HAD superfamily hydrolase (TIGR01450 family)
VKSLQAHKKQLIFVSNNCGKTVDQLQHKMKTLLNIHNIPSRNIITSGVSTAIYLKSKMNVDSEKVFLIAQDAFQRTLADHGIKSFGLGPVEIKQVPEWQYFEVDKSVKYVIVSYDPFFSPTKLTEAYMYIKENNAEYILPDCDNFFSVSPTRKVPGSLSISAGLTAVLEQQPKIMGKPDPFLFELIQQEHGKMMPSRTIMIGDNYKTDIEFGFNCGISTALVLTGNTKSEDVASLKKMPDFVLEGLCDISDCSEDT